MEAFQIPRGTMIDSRPLAERMRPKHLDDIIGQDHLIGKEGPIRKLVKSGNVPSMILWGPPGVGKTTLAEVLSKELDRPFHQLSAINSGVKDIREVITSAKRNDLFAGGRPILFIDEIHRFSKSQQDALLDAVERGHITLIGATTENPSFEVIPALLSRSQVYTLKHLESKDLDKLLDMAISRDSECKERQIELRERKALKRASGGDGRKLLNALELVVKFKEETPLIITDALVNDLIKENVAFYDKGGEQHYDIISAFIKSIRGSDPNAAVYYLARMLEGGEDVKFIARRLLILASEDIGLANPNALLMAEATFSAVERLGMPEARIPLSECAIYLAVSEKSNSAYLAIDAALEHCRTNGAQAIPLHLRNAPTKLMKEMGYGSDYLYAHNYEGGFVQQNYLPESMIGQTFYHPSTNSKEEIFKKRLNLIWKDQYDY
jgi:putative ATPase